MSRPWDWSALGLDADPVPGSAPDVRATATEARGTADLIAEQTGTLRTASSRGGEAWEGEAAQEFRLAAQPLADAIAKAERRYRDLAAALDDYARGLEDLQPQVDAALERAEDAERARRRADLTGADAEPGSTQEQDHRDALDRADADLAAEKALLRRLVGLGAVGEDGEFGELNDALVRAVARAGDDELRDIWWDEVKQTIHESRGWLNVTKDVLGWIGTISSVVAMFAGPLAPLFIGISIGAGVCSLFITLAESLAGDATAGDVLTDLAGVGLSFIGLGAGVQVARANLKLTESVVHTTAGRATAGMTRGRATDALRREIKSGLETRASALSRNTWLDVDDAFFSGGLIRLARTRNLGEVGPSGEIHYRTGVWWAGTAAASNLVNNASFISGTAQQVGSVVNGTYWRDKTRVSVGSL